MTDEKQVLTSKDFGIELSKVPKNKQEQLEKSLGVLIKQLRGLFKKVKIKVNYNEKGK